LPLLSFGRVRSTFAPGGVRVRVFPDKTGRASFFRESSRLRPLSQDKTILLKRRSEASKRAGLADYYILGLKKIKQKRQNRRFLSLIATPSRVGNVATIGRFSLIITSIIKRRGAQPLKKRTPQDKKEIKNERRETVRLKRTEAGAKRRRRD